MKPRPKENRLAVFGKNLLSRPPDGQLKSFCAFIGYPRSGHSIVGALLDAHPNCVISHEASVVDLLDQGYRRNAILSSIVRNANVKAQSGRVSNGYSYAVKGQYQGRFTDLTVVGDKKGGRTSRWLVRRPDLLQEIHEQVRLPLKLIHVYRHPLDNLASRSKGGNLNKKIATTATMEKAIDAHFAQVEANAKIIADGKHDVFNVKQEQFIAEPKVVLRDLCSFLGLPADDKYLSDCAAIVFQKPHETRHDVAICQDFEAQIRERSMKYDFLKSYYA